MVLPGETKPADADDRVMNFVPVKPMLG